MLLGLLPSIRSLGRRPDSAQDMRHVQGRLLQVLSRLWSGRRFPDSPRYTSVAGSAALLRPGGRPLTLDLSALSAPSARRGRARRR